MNKTPEEIVEFHEKLLSEASCLDTLENEVLKLYVLFTQLSRDKEHFTADYVLEKIGNVNRKYPIILHPRLWDEYYKIRLARFLTEK